MSKMSIDLSSFAKHRSLKLRRTLNGRTMGTRYSAVFFAPLATDVAKLESAVFAAVDGVDREMSTWNPQSDLSRLNAAPVGAWLDMPRNLMTVIAAALAVEESSHGAFDISVGDIVSAWGFGPAAGSAPATRPPPSLGASLAASRAVEIAADGGKIRKVMPVSLDLSGIAKGFGVDEMARVMDAFCIPAWLVGIDGEMRAKGTKPDGTMWSVAHERPDRHAREAMGVIELQDMAVATSGNYRHVIEVDGKTVSHTIDPRSAMPLDNTVASVTVLAPTCMMADAWATAFLVMGADAACAVAPSHGLEVISVLQDGSIQSTL